MRQPYLLLTPGPLSTSEAVKAAMQIDYCTWDADYCTITETIRQQLLTVAQVEATDYTSILLQGSGSYGVEATIGTAVPKENAVLMIAMNGAYGQRMGEIADYYHISHVDLKFAETEAVTAPRIREALDAHPEVTHFAMVHNETTTGILNPIEQILPLLNDRGIISIIDAMSSFGGVPLNLSELNCDYLISSANKCIQGVPGFAFVIAKLNTLETTKDNARSLSLDLYAQWQTMLAQPGKWRFTSPTQVVHAFAVALNELNEEGGVVTRYLRYADNQRRLSLGMQALGFETVINSAIQGPIITSFKYPTADFDFPAFYQYLKNNGFVIYPGKVTDLPSFRIGTIGEIYPRDIEDLLHVIKQSQFAPQVVKN